jgi:WD40 repeat protein
VRQYDVKTGKELHKFLGYIAAFGPGKKEIITGSRAGSKTKIFVHDAATGAKLRELEAPEDLQNFWLSPAGDCVLTGSPKGYRLMNLETKQTALFFNSDPSVGGAGFVPGGKYLLLCNGKLPWQVYDCSNTKSSTEFAKLNPNPSKSEPFKNITSKPRFFLVPDGKRVFVRDQSVLHFYDISTGVESKKVTLGQDHPEALALSPDSKRALASYKDQTIRLWALGGERELCRFSTAHLDRVKAFVFSGDGRFACAGGSTGWVHVWRLPESPK